jgi:hypothetical protein
MALHRVVLLAVAVAMAIKFSPVQAAEPSTPDAAQAPTNASAPVADQESPGERPADADRPAAPLDPQVERILDNLERKGRTLTDIQAKLQYVKQDEVLDSKQVFTGILLFKDADPNPIFHIRFDRSVHDGIVNKKKEYHVFDGRDYVEARETTKTINRRRIVEPGEQVEVFRLGQGPFPLPFGQRKADIVHHFTVRLVPPAEDDPRNTDHLECTPLPGTELERRYGTIHFYVYRSLHLPVKMSTVDKNEDQKISATFSDLKFEPIAASQLNLPRLGGYVEITDDTR